MADTAAMELLVRRFDLMTAADEQRRQLSDELQDNEDRHEAVVNEDDLLAAFHVFRKSVCRPDFPGESSDQCYFAKDILDALMEWSAKLKESGKISSFDRIHDYCLDFLHDLLKQGPGTGHIELWVKMFTCGDFAFTEYYFNLKGDKLKNHVRFLMREFRTQEIGPDRDRFEIAMEKGMRFVLDAQSFSEEAYKEAQTEFIELYIYMELKFLSKSEGVQDIHHKISIQLWGKYNRNLFKDIEDPNMFKQFLKRLEEIICHTDLTTAESDKVLKKIVEFVKMLLAAIDKAYVFHEVHGEILDFVSNICEKKTGSPLHTIVEAVGYFYCHLKEKKEDPIITGNCELFSVMTPKLTEFLTNVEDHTLLRVKFADAAVCDVLVKAMSKTPEHQRLMLDLIKACLCIRHPNTAKAAYNGIRECETKLKWKEHLGDAREIMDLVAGARIYGSDRRAKEEYAGYYNKLCDYLARGLTRDRVISQLVDKIVEFCFKILDTREQLLFESGSQLADQVELSGKKHKDLIMSIFTNLLPYLKDDKFPWTGSGFDYGPRIVTQLAGTAIQAIDSRVFKPEDYDVICHFVLTVMKGDFIDPDLNIPLSIHYLLYCNVGTRFLTLLDDQEKLQRCSPLIREIVNMMNHEYDEIVDMACNQIQAIAGNAAKALAPFLSNILDVYIDTEKTNLLYPITQIYPHNPRPLEPHFQTIFELIDTQERSTVLMLLAEVAKKQPQLFTDENISSLFKEMFQGDDRMQSSYLMVMETLSRKMPEKFVPHMKTLMEGPINIQYGAMYQTCQVLKNVAVGTKDEVLAETVMFFLEKHLQGPDDQMVTSFCLNEMRAIGGVYRPLLEKRKGVIEDLRNRSNVQTTKDQCNLILDVPEVREKTGSIDSLKDSVVSVSTDLLSLKKHHQECEDRFNRLILENRQLVDALTSKVQSQQMQIESLTYQLEMQGKQIETLTTALNSSQGPVL